MVLKQFRTMWYGTKTVRSNCMVMQASNPSTWGGKQEDGGFRAGLGCLLRPCLKQEILTVGGAPFVVVQAT